MLARLARVNRVVAFGVTVLLVLLGLFLPGIVGGLVLVVLMGALLALMTRTWPVTPPQTRVLRVVILAVLALVTLAKVM